jgi:energy-coupling factor transporter ATP-binding protein EcfA2
MAAPLFVGIGVAIFAVAKVFSWLANSMTEEEERKHAQEHARTDEIRRRAAAAQARQEQRAWEEYREMVLEHVQLLRRVIRENREAIVGIPEELSKLEQMVAQEISDKTSSPYRKSALRREYARVEDAVVRMKEYERYLTFAENEVDALLVGEHYALLLALDPADKLLPLEWLYPGKLVLVAMEEISRPLPRFGHRISFGTDDVSQKALALPFNDEIPVLIKSATKWDNGSFYGCVARGALYYNHIITGEPVPFIVERKQKQSMIGTLFDGLIRATLPVSQLKHPGVRLLSGQKILVHPTQYDLCLLRNPFEQGRTNIEVSEFNYRARGVQSYQQLYLTVDEKHLEGVTDQQFFEEDEPWTLLGYSSATGMISLGKASVRVECAPTTNFSLLEVHQVIQTGTLQIGLDTPFRFTLLNQKLAAMSQVGWRSGVEEFLRFCSQTAMDMKDSPERLAHSRFYQRWEQVIAYQRSQEEVSALDFSASMLLVQEDDVLVLQRDSLPPSDHEAFEGLAEKLREVLSDKNFLNPDHCVRLLLWDADRCEFVPAVSRDRRRRPLYICTKSSISIESAFSLPEEPNAMLRLVVTVPSAALKRQAQALEDFFNDQLVNPALKSILLAPEHYLAEPTERSRDIAWSGPLDESQKRVVELALSERNIALIQGPPGAGKTTAIVEILYQLYRQRSDLRILVVSQQNSAVDNALEKFLAEHAHGFDHAIRTIRIGNPEKMSSVIKPLGFDSQFSEYLAELEDLAIAGAVSLPDNEAALCHMWLSSIKQASQSRANQDEFFITLLADRNLVGATCVGLATNKGGIDQLQFDVAIIDEAGRATIPEILIPILRSNKVILVGDHYQLPPSIAPLLREDEAAEELGFLRENFLDTSFFELMFERLPPQCRETLSLQYRMAPAIGDLVAELFYMREGKRVLHNGRDNAYFEERYVLEKSIYWVDVKGRQSQPKGSQSKENRDEAKEITQFLANLAESTTRPISVAVITPYGAQKECVRASLRKIGWVEGKLGQLSIAVDTVDAFQGSEADIVCYSTVRTEGNLNFILDRKRLNVACSRAKLHLLFFGHRDFLRRWSSNKSSEENIFPRLMQNAWNVSVAFSRREEPQVEENEN